MKPLVSLGEQKDLIAHLEAQFGCGCYQFDGGIVAPPMAAVIFVEEPLETCCTDKEGQHLITSDGKRCIAPGIYTVSMLDDLGGGRWLDLAPLNSQPHMCVMARVGRFDGTGVDWRGVRDYLKMPASLAIPQAESA